jgi:hypothetical protein
MTFTGTVADINAALAWISYRPAAGVTIRPSDWKAAIQLAASTLTTS